MDYAAPNCDLRQSNVLTCYTGGGRRAARRTDDRGEGLLHVRSVEHHGGVRDLLADTAVNNEIVASACSAYFPSAPNRYVTRIPYRRGSP